MYFLLSSLLSYWQFYDIGKNKRFFDVPLTYAFESGGNFSIKVENCKSSELLLIISSQDNLDKYMNEQDMFQPCNINLNYTYHISIFKGIGSISGTINEKGIYKTKIVSCSYFFEKYYIELKYQNPNSLLSANYIPCLTSSPLIAYASCLMLFIWLLNWIFYFQNHNRDHIILSIGFILYTLERVFYAIDLKKLDKNEDNFEKIYIRSLIIHVLKLAFFDWAFFSISLTKYAFACFGVIAEIALFSGLILFSLFRFSCNILHFITFVIILIIIEIIMYDGEIAASKKPNHFLAFSLFYMLSSDFIKVYYLIPYEILLILDSTNFILLVSIGFSYRLRKCTLFGYQIVFDSDIPEIQ